jgi:hypothetical protein
MEVKTGRDLHKSLHLLPKKCKKGLPLFIDLRLKSSNSKEGSGVTLSAYYKEVERERHGNLRLLKLNCPKTT